MSWSYDYLVECWDFSEGLWHAIVLQDAVYSLHWAGHVWSDTSLGTFQYNSSFATPEEAKAWCEEVIERQKISNTASTLKSH